MYYDYYENEVVGTLTLVGDEQGIRHIGFPKDKYPLAINKKWRQNPDLFTTIKSQLAAYFSGKRQTFDLPLNPAGTPFQLKVWAALQTIPYGQLVSYKWVAESIGKPRAVRAVGAANGRNPLPIVIPCHRVVGSDGSLTGFGGGLDLKQRLIHLENPQVAMGHRQQVLFAD